MDPAPSTEKPSRELKNTYQARGLHSEYLVSRDLERRGFFILAKNSGFFGVEVDILALKQDACLLVEVKSIRYKDQENIIKSSQKKRLRSVVDALSLELQGDIALFIALVDRNKSISYFELI